MTNKYYFENEVFSQNYKFQFIPDHELIDQILSLTKTAKILELGCGDGANSIALVKKGYDITCCDISSTAIQQIQNYAKTNNLKINALVKDLENYKITQTYNIIFSTGVFHFLDKITLKQLIKNIQNNTKPNGYNIFEVLLEGDYTQTHNKFGHYFKSQELKNIYVQPNWKILSYQEYESYDSQTKTYNKIAEICTQKHQHK